MNGKSDDLHRRSDWVDPDDAPELTEEFFEKGQWRIGDKVVSREEGMAAARKALRRGRPKKAARKVQVSIRYSPEVLAHFRATGKGWQTRMDEALKEWIAEHGG
jgi:uncharacterized protein (DUF4415 family)